MTGLEPDAVREQLERILASEGFVNSDRIARFLRFTLESKLNGEQDQIKEYVIGREVFDRDGRYDPRIDPIVRVEARRLRARLTEYYDGPGQRDPIRIELPKGGYVPEIACADASRATASANSSTSRGRPYWLTAAGVLLAAVATAGFYALRNSVDPEMIAVIPAGWFWQGRESLGEVEEGISEAVAAEIANRRFARVVAWPLLMRYRNAGKETPSLAAEMGATKLLLVSAREQGAGVRVTLFFADAMTNQKHWTVEYTLADANTAKDQQEAARAVDAIQSRLRDDSCGPPAR